MGGKVEEISEELGGRGNHKKNILDEKNPFSVKERRNVLIGSRLLWL